MWSTIQKARLSLGKAGVARTAQRALQRLVPHWLFDFNSLVAQELKFADSVLPPVDEKWRHRWAGEDDFDVIIQSGIPPHQVRAFFAGGARAALCVKDGRLIAYTWFLPNPHTVFDWIRVIPDRDVYIAAAFVAPEFRGRKISFETRKFAYPALAALGYTGIISFVEALNRSSIRTTHAGVRRYIGRLSYVRLLGLVIYRLNGRWGAGFWNRARPYDLSFGDFDRDNFCFAHVDSRSAPKGPPNFS